MALGQLAAMEAVPCTGGPCLSVQQEIAELAACGPPASDSPALAAVAARQLELVQASKGWDPGGLGVAVAKAQSSTLRLCDPAFPARTPSPSPQASAGLPHWAGRRACMLFDLAKAGQSSLRVAAVVLSSAALEAWLTAAAPLDDPETAQVCGLGACTGGVCLVCV